MNVNGVFGNQQGGPVDQTSFKSRMEQTFAPVAKLFNESTDQLESELQTSGTSLSALAQQKGISQDDLLSAIKQGLQSSSTNGASPLSDSQLTTIANRIANHVHGGHHHHHRPPSTDDQTATSTASTTPGDSTIALSM